MTLNTEQHSRLNRRSFSLGMLALPVVGFAGCQSAPSPSAMDSDAASLGESPKSPAIGEEFHYQHEGPRPFDDPSMDASGVRAVRVFSREESGQRLWRVEEVFENSHGIIAYFIDNAFRLHQQLLISSEGEYIVEFNPPLPLRYQNLATDASMQIRTRQLFREEGVREPLARFDISGRASRRYDERIITPLGAFLCRSFDVGLDYDITVERTRIQYSVQIRSYWADAFSWYIGEEYQFSSTRMDGQEAQPEYQCQSFLSDYIPPRI